MGDTAREIGKHFARVSALLVATWGLKKLLIRTPEEGLANGDKPEKPRRTQSYRLLPSPDSQLELATPGWLSQYEDPESEASAPPEFVTNALEDIQRDRESFQLGHSSLRDKLFLLKTDVAQHYLNAGSYGGAYKLAVETQAWYQNLLEAEPCFFYTETAPKALQVAKEAVADFIHANVADIVHLTNATEAVNTVLLSTPLRKRDLLLVTSITYPAVRNAASRFSGRAGAGIVEVLLDLETLVQGNKAVLSRFHSTIAQYGSRIKLAILDHITSNPTYHMPVVEIAAICRKHGVKVLVDGAHAVGSVPLDVPSLGVHYYTSNLHKWGCCPKSAAFMWVHASQQSGMVPLVTSHGYKTGFQGEFAWPGTTDISAWLAVTAALRTKSALGVQRLRDHNHQKLQWAVDMLSKAWGPSLHTLGSEASCSHMASIELPQMPAYPCSSRAAADLHSHLLEDRKIEVPISFWERKLWVRISAQIYNTEEDYRALREAVVNLVSP